MRDQPPLHALAWSAASRPRRSRRAARSCPGSARRPRRPGGHGCAGDEGPAGREKLLAADILVFAKPTWVGHMTSVAQGVLERLDGEPSEIDDSGRPLIAGKVAVVAVVGNEDGAHHISADAFQALADVGFTIPAQ